MPRPTMLDADSYVFGSYEVMGASLCDCGIHAPRTFDLMAADAMGLPTPVLRLCAGCAPQLAARVYAEHARLHPPIPPTRQQRRWARRRARPLGPVPAFVSLHVGAELYDSYDC